MKTMVRNKYFSCLLLILCSFYNVHAQQDSLTHPHKKRLKPLLISSTVVYSASVVGLNQLWYSDFEKEGFHFFNDNKEWLQMDKAGHFFSAYQISSAGYAGLRWAGVERNKSLLWGSLASFLILTPIEIMDGFSSAYGASYGDFIANTSGALFFTGQQMLWQEARLHPKFSFHRTKYAPLRPSVLGSNVVEEILKDYNGGTFWVSVDLSKFMKKSSFPRWLNIAIGYGGEGMVYANQAQNREAGFQCTRQYYIALDFDFNEYTSKSGLVNTLIHLVNMIHLPAPGVELSGNELKFNFY